MCVVPTALGASASFSRVQVVAHEGSGTRISVSFNVRVTFPPEDDERGGFVAAAAADLAADGKALPNLSFVVPPHHQEAFRDSKLTTDMKVNEKGGAAAGGAGGAGGAASARPAAAKKRRKK